MDYKNIYYKIVERAKQEDDNGHRQLGYYEKHHIKPKSLGGTNDKENLVKLTAREHFLCHWLLVKMYNKGTIERNKMLYALWRMKSKNNIHERYINSRAYEALRIEYSGVISKITSIKQSGEKNSQFGKNGIRIVILEKVNHFSKNQVTHGLKDVTGLITLLNMKFIQ